MPGRDEQLAQGDEIADADLSNRDLRSVLADELAQLGIVVDG